VVNHHPVYTFLKDTKKGQTNGEELDAFGAHWYALSSAGAKVEKASSKKATSSYALGTGRATQGRKRERCPTLPRAERRRPADRVVDELGVGGELVEDLVHGSAVGVEGYAGEV
jgi:hypothetical protein